MNSHHNLSEIFYVLWQQQLAPKGSFIDQVFRLVLFHNSIWALEMSPNLVSLSEADQKAYCDKSFERLMQVLLIADNESYTLFD